MTSLIDKIDRNRVPGHVAIIMDGNGRWAKERSMDRSAGHVEGVNTVRRITEAASEAGFRCFPGSECQDRTGSMIIPGQLRVLRLWGCGAWAVLL